MEQITYHENVSRMQDKVIETRAALAGEFFVKELRTTLLPHPSSVDSTSADAQERYNIYLSNAEYDGYPAQTLESLIGRMKFDSATIELPEKISYLIESADGDGLSLQGMMQNSAAEILPLKWQCLVADYQGLSDVNIEDISLEEVRRLNPRSTIKAYSRENVVNWHFERVNGTLQLVYLLLREVGSTFDSVNGLRSKVESFLILGIDENGNYYQQKIVRGIDSGLETGDLSYVTLNKAPLKWIPAIFASDKELAAGKLPLELGYLSPICDLALARYRMSAEYKETMRNLPPTTYVTGANTNYQEDFQKANNGRKFIMTGSGSVNVLPDGCIISVVGADTAVEPYERYFERNTEQARQLGAVIKDSSSVKTATEVAADSSESNSRLVSLANSLEQCYRRLCLYCGMFEGLWAADAIESNMDKVVIELTREFTQAKLSPQERTAILNEYLAGLIPKSEALAQLQAGGALEEDAQTLLDMADSGQI